MKRHFLTIVFLGFVLGAGGQAVSTIRKIKFKGNSSIADSRLKSEVGIKTYSGLSERFFDKISDRYTEALYEESLERIRYVYQKEGYLNVRFEAPTIHRKRNGKIKLSYHIVEGEAIKLTGVSYTIDSVSTLKDFFDKQVQRQIRLQSQLKVNKRFRDEWYYEDQVFINEELNNMGYAYARVRHNLQVDTVRNTAHLNWIIDKGELCYFGPISIDGNIRVPEKRIRRQLRFSTGDTWSKEAIDDTQKQIYNLGMFRVASIKTLMSEEKPDTLPTLISLKEAPRWTSRFGVGYGREDKFRVFGDVQYLGLISKTARLNIVAKHSALEPYNFQLKLSQPAVLLPYNTVTLNPYAMKQHEPGYKINRRGLNLTFLQNFSERFNSSFNIYVEKVESDSSAVASGGWNTADGMATSSYGKSGVSMGFIYANGEPRLDPVTGYSLAVNIKRNGSFLEESIPFYRSLLEYKNYLGVRPGLTLALKAKMGLAFRKGGGELVPVEERFYAGGSYSVRGWSRAQLGPKDALGVPVGGNSLLEGSFEGRYLMASNLVFAVFCDAGNVWLDDFQYPLRQLRYAAGIGIRYKTPIGPVGIDFARPIFDEVKAWQIHFNIGNPF
ncbi:MULTISPECIES: BamA/OMP85 family outer membrane protein [unclassified Carboxylicivirga]|uniref:BamA/OMP85 family outer membrane protein n=1 Tax=Carboxylicivirga TaxID=1628153 RepID=UPI003D34F6AF